MEHLAIWFEDTTQTRGWISEGPTAQGLPVSALAEWLSRHPEGQVVAHRLAAPDFLSAVCVTVATSVDEVIQELRPLCLAQGTIAWVRDCNEASSQASWDEGKPWFPGHPTGPTLMGPPAGLVPSAPEDTLPPAGLAWMVATLDELTQPAPAVATTEPLPQNLHALAHQVIAHVVTHTAQEGQMVPWAQAEAALHRVLATPANVVSAEDPVSPARRHYELMKIHEELGKWDRGAAVTLLCAAVAVGLPASLALGAGWLVWRQWVDHRVARSPRLRQRFLRGLSPAGMVMAPEEIPTSRRVAPAQPVVMDHWEELVWLLKDFPQRTQLLAWVRAWWPLHRALVKAKRRKPLSLTHSDQWGTVTFRALIADLGDPLQRPLSPDLRQAANHYRQASAPWVAQESHMLHLWQAALAQAKRAHET
jgi:hypothetical protein